MTKLMKADIERELIDITQQILNELNEPFKQNIRLTDSLQHLGLDSLGRAELFQRINKVFKVSIPDRMLAEAESLNDIADFIVKAEPSIDTKDASKIINHRERTHADPSKANSLVDVLTIFNQDAPQKPHIYFYNENGQEEIITYQKLFSNSLKVANYLKEHGLKEGETVAIMQPSHPNFFYSFFGTLMAGGVPVPIYPPFRMHMLEAYAKLESKILRSASVRFLITFTQAEKLSHLLKAFVPSLKHVTTVEGMLKFSELIPFFVPTEKNFGMIQYTSGSTNDPKGVLLTHANLLFNIRAYGKAILAGPEDVAVSWLPLYHDLGLIGMWLGSLYHGVPLVLLTPFTFLNHPERWLWAIHYHRGTLSGAPNFAYELCIKKLEPQQLEGLDLSTWRMAANGAEKIYPQTLENFAKKFAPYGFKKEALFPVYGLAESTVGLIIGHPGKLYRTDSVDREQFEEKQIAVPSEAKNALTFVSCGMPLPGHEVKIVDENENLLPERHVGRLLFKGPSNMQGYYNNPKASNAVFYDGWIDSGDLAYLADGEYYITGRKKDLIIKAGRNIYPAEIEELVGKIEGIRQGCVIAFGDVDPIHGTEQLIVVAETRIRNTIEKEKISSTIRSLMSEQLDIAPDRIFLVAPHIVPKTSSGKLQRAPCKKMYKAGQLEQSKMPTWMQVTRLSLQWFLKKCQKAISLIVKCIYTGYVGFVVLLTFLPFYTVICLTKRDVAAKTLKLWAKMIYRLALCRVKIYNPENLQKDQPLIYAANHSSYLDSIILLAILPYQTHFVGKKELLSVPLLKTVINKLGYLSVDRVDLSKGVLETHQIQEVLKAGDSVMIFPEGTFGYAPGLRPFRLGAFKTAVEANISVCPIAIQGTRYMLRADEKLMWPGYLTITISQPIKPQGTEWHDVIELRNQVRQAIAKDCGEASLDYIAAEHVAKKFPD